MQTYLKHVSYFLTIVFLVSSCATYNAEYANDNWQENIDTLVDDSKIEYSFYLIGDAGNANLNKDLTHLNLLKKELITASKESTVLFLGDNIYEKGLPKKDNPERKLAEHRLNAQLKLVENYKGQTIFIPGNHDYYNNGIEGLARQENYITKKLQNKNAFLPKNGCAIEKVNISENIVLIIIDSQWYLEDWNKNPTINDDCEIKTRHDFFNEFESLIKKNEDKTTLIAIHHPMFSYGAHGGEFSLKKQLYPFGNKVPLPILGSFINLLRKTSGISPQDIQNTMYRELKERILTLSQKNNNIIFVSGHEHNLQYIEEQKKPQIISGSGSKISEARVLNGSKFSYGNLGYAKLDILKNGTSWVYYFTEIDSKKILLFKTQIFSEKEEKKQYNFPDKIPKKIESSVYTDDEVDKNFIYNGIWGTHYRKYFGKKINAKTANLDSIYGGLTPTREGGGNQSKSLRLKDKNGKEYVMRALRKSATQYLQAVAFKTKNISDKFNNTLAEKLLQDIYTTTHPYTPLAISKLSDAVNIYHSNPTLYYIPKQPALKHFNTDFGDELYMIEERADEGHGDLKSFGYSNNLISTSDLLQKLRKSDDNYIDEDAYIRARLFDMLIGDWDRHEDQWRWAEFEIDNKKMYKPVPRDRDQAFSKYDGVLLGFATRIIPALKQMQVYDTNIRNIKWFNSAAYYLDIALINKSTYTNWENQVAFIQKNLTSTVIDSAFKELPIEVQDETIEKIKYKLKGRLNNLDKIAKEYYKHLAKYPIVKGTDKDNWFDIERKKDGNTLITVYNIKNSKKGSKIFEKLYLKNEVKEIWVYGLHKKDVFNITGVYTNVIPLRLIGGQNNDEYNIEKGNKITIYDYKTKKNTFNSTNINKRISDNYELNSYHPKKPKYNQTQILPSLGANPDDGLRNGIKFQHTIYGFERNPFTQQHTINASYYYSHMGYDILYNAEFASIFNNWNLLFETHFTSPNYSINYYGLGNETLNFEDDFNKDYHRVKLSTFAINPSLKWKGTIGAEFKVGAILESIEIEDSKDRFINTISTEIEERKTFIGIQTVYQFENKDSKTFPTIGFLASFETGIKKNINDTGYFGYLSPTLSFTHKITSNKTMVLATKLNGKILFGDSFEFYHAASIGSKNGLRGYRSERFSGNKSFYQNTDLRFNLKEFKSSLAPIQIGLFTGFDYGRVWLKNENSNKWKTSYGGGFWIVGADLLNLNLSVFNSKEGAYINFGIGFGF